MITLKHKGNFSKVTAFLERAKKGARVSSLDKYAQQCVDALSSATPVKTGLTAGSWYYEIERTNGAVKISFCNSNIQNGWAPVAILLQYGHATRNGGWVEGRDYINPAIQPLFDKITKEAWREVTNS